MILQKCEIEMHGFGYTDVNIEYLTLRSNLETLTLYYKSLNIMQDELIDDERFISNDQNERLQLIKDIASYVGNEGYLTLIDYCQELKDVSMISIPYDAYLSDCKERKEQSARYLKSHLKKHESIKVRPEYKEVTYAIRSHIEALNNLEKVYLEGQNIYNESFIAFKKYKQKNPLFDVAEYMLHAKQTYEDLTERAGSFR